MRRERDRTRPPVFMLYSDRERENKKSSFKHDTEAPFFRSFFIDVQAEERKKP